MKILFSIAVTASIFMTMSIYCYDIGYAHDTLSAAPVVDIAVFESPEKFLQMINAQPTVGELEFEADSEENNFPQIDNQEIEEADENKKAQLIQTINNNGHITPQLIKQYALPNSIFNVGKGRKISGIYDGDSEQLVLAVYTTQYVRMKPTIKLVWFFLIKSQERTTIKLIQNAQGAIVGEKRQYVSPITEISKAFYGSSAQNINQWKDVTSILKEVSRQSDGTYYHAGKKDWMKQAFGETNDIAPAKLEANFTVEGIEKPIKNWQWSEDAEFAYY